MKRITTVLCASVVLFACSQNKTTETKNDSTSTTTTTTASSEAKSEEWTPVDSATCMKAMMQAGTPGEMHKMLAKSEGNWDAETTMWEKDGGAPMKGKGTSSNKMIMGGRYEQTAFMGNFMGMPFEGGGITGYDNTKKVFFSTWMDNMSTAMMNMEGTWDEATKSINFKGSMQCPANGKNMTIREVRKWMDDNTMTLEMYGPDMQTGKEYKNMEIKFTRKK